MPGVGATKVRMEPAETQQVPKEKLSFFPWLNLKETKEAGSGNAVTWYRL
jgi:hypothetical protein